MAFSVMGTARTNNTANHVDGCGPNLVQTSARVLEVHVCLQSGLHGPTTLAS